MLGPAEIIQGVVMHDRLRPRRNRFSYPVFCLRFDLARLNELDNAWFGVDRWRPLSLRLADHGPRDGSSLLTWIRDLLRDAGVPHDGAVHLQAFPRVLGYAFNPVSFWFCHDSEGDLRSVLAEVNNTFGERHLYLLQRVDGGQIGATTELQCRKVFHVSPFCRVEGHYRFRFRDTPLGRFAGIDYHDNAGLLMRTCINGRVQAFSPANLRRNLLRQPLLCLGVVARIHWQALRLWLGRVPFHRKPEPPQEEISQDVSPIAVPPSRKEPL